jgi:excinuclease ABC subunit C
MPSRRSRPAPEAGEGLAALEPELRDKLSRLPREPGVYLLRDRRGKVMYVGKARNLLARVRSYFSRSGDTRAFVPLLARLLDDVETVVTRSDKEALLLENSLIKLHRPRFNVMLRDDKSFLMLRIDRKHPWPRVDVVRRIKQDGARYFGPYDSATSCRQTLRFLGRHFRLRTCTDRDFATRKRPCLQYHIGRCPAPCVLDTSAEEYAAEVAAVELFLSGKRERLVEDLRDKMRAASAAQAYERAAMLRDRVGAIERALAGQRVVLHDAVDIDAFGLHREGTAVDISVLHVRDGKLLGHRLHHFAHQEFPDDEIVGSFVAQFYDRGETVPDEVLLPVGIEGVGIAEWLREKAGRRVDVIVPKRGSRRELLDIAARNAFAQSQARGEEREELHASLLRVQERLRLKRPPRRIECYDISHLQGVATVGSLVTLQDGRPDKTSYRRFRLRFSAERDDFASLYEVLSRRLRRARDGEARWALPDLLVVDGGKGQLQVARTALRDAGIAEPPDLAAIAKDPDRVFLVGAKDPEPLRSNSAELYVLAQARDEAHRFAIAYHRKLRRRLAFASTLDEVEGVGQERRRALLRHFGSLRRLREASVDQIAEVPGMTHAAAQAVVRALGAATRTLASPTGGS